MRQNITVLLLVINQQYTKGAAQQLKIGQNELASRVVGLHSGKRKIKWKCLCFLSCFYSHAPKEFFDLFSSSAIVTAAMRHTKKCPPPFYRVDLL